LQGEIARGDLEVVGFLDKSDEAGIRQGIDCQGSVADAERKDGDGAPGNEFQDGGHGLVLRWKS
jgi:hypothetical protein